MHHFHRFCIFFLFSASHTGKEGTPVGSYSGKVLQMSFDHVKVTF